MLQPSNRNSPLRDAMASRLVEGLEAGREEEKYTGYQETPEDFITEVLGETNIWSTLIEILHSIKDNRKTAVKSANAVGKTFIAARAAYWWLHAFPYRNKVLTTAAPPERQIKELLWGEIRQVHANLKTRKNFDDLGARLSPMALKIGENWWAQGFTVPLTGTVEQRIARFSGHHAEHMLIIMDEAHGIPPEVFQAVESCMSAKHNHLLLLSNPLAPSGPFYNSTLDPAFNTISISAFDHPNVITGQEVVPGCVSREVTQQRLDKWSRELYEGEEEDASVFVVPDFMSVETASTKRKVTFPSLYNMTLGEFPGQAENALINMVWIRKAIDNWQPRPPEEEAGIAGFDVAEMGVDSNALVIRRDHWVSQIERWTEPDALKNGAKLKAKVRALPNMSKVFSDAGGVGTSIAYQFTEEDGVLAQGIKVSWSPTAKGEEWEFKILRDQLLWAIREWLRTEPNAMLPDDPKLIQELAVLTYEIDMFGKINVLKKKAIRKLISRSPDSLDALAMTFYTGKQWKSMGKTIKV